jgi:hypothetical protein
MQCKEKHGACCGLPSLSIANCETRTEYCRTDKFAFSLAFAESIFKKSILKITKYWKKVF